MARFRLACRSWAHRQTMILPLVGAYFRIDNVFY